MIGSEMCVTLGEGPIGLIEPLVGLRNKLSLSAGLAELVGCGPGAAVTPLLEPL